MNPKVKTYLSDGCMQCKLGGTPECKIHAWQKELRTLRNYVLDCGLEEDFKWMHPTYTWQNKNIATIHSFNEYCALLFHKGALLKNFDKLLIQQTENTQSARQLRFKNLQDIQSLENIIKAHLYEAIEVEKLRLKVQLKDTSEYAVPIELLEKFEEDKAFKQAFDSLTPGRKKGYLLFFSQAKQSQTQRARIDKAKTKIFEGKGHNER
jgi:uncharacterized protein YdeI (YjbR/CyaY-like superfamily)